MRYYWEEIPKSKEYALFVSGIEIGRYDRATDVYRRVNGDGTLSGPSAKPWTLPSEPTSNSTAPGKATPPSCEATREDVLSPSDAPPWLMYAIGGGVTVAVLLTGLLLQGMKKELV